MRAPAGLEALFTDEWAIDRRARTPAYAQIEERVTDLIASGALGVGDRLPPERDLAMWVGVSRMTARAALRSLAQRGLLERDVGRGTFVSSPRVERDLGRFAGFTEMVRRQGMTATARLRSLNELPAPDAVAAALALAPGDAVYRVERLRLAGGEPLTLEDAWLPADRFPGLLDHDVRGSLYELMRDAYDLGPVRAVERLEPVLADAELAAALGVPEGAPLMLVERVAHAAGGTPVEFARDHHRADRARFVVQVSTEGVAAG